MPHCTKMVQQEGGTTDLLTQEEHAHNKEACSVALDEIELLEVHHNNENNSSCNQQPPAPPLALPAPRPYRPTDLHLHPRVIEVLSTLAVVGSVIGVFILMHWLLSLLTESLTLEGTIGKEKRLQLDFADSKRDFLLLDISSNGSFAAGVWCQAVDVSNEDTFRFVELKEYGEGEHHIRADNNRCQNTENSMFLLVPAKEAPENETVTITGHLRLPQLSSAGLQFVSFLATLATGLVAWCVIAIIHDMYCR